MSFTNRVLVLSLVVTGMVGCAGEAAPAGPRDDGGLAGTDGSIVGGDAGPVTTSGLPCEVAMVLTSRCTSCHGPTPTGGATVSLVSRDRLLAMSPTMPARRVIDVAIERMRATTGQMPPPPTSPTPEAEIAILESWVAAGTPEGSCEVEPDPLFTGPDTCTTGMMWTGGNRESPLMRPGGACIDCHTTMREGPRRPLTLAGTVYSSGREIDDCNGIAGSTSDPITIEVHDMMGRVISMAPNAAGNFYSSDAVTFPITAVVRYQGRERVMATPVMSGDCNSCHTLRGTMDAPGRIVLP